MTDQERDILFSLSETMYRTRNEIDVMRPLLQMAIGVLQMQPESKANFERLLSHVSEAVHTHGLNSKLTDAQLQEQRQLMKQLVGPDLAQHITD